MSHTQNREIARRFIQEVCNEGKLDQIEKCVAPDIIWHGMEEIKGVEDFRRSILDDKNSFPDIQFTIVDEFADQSKVAIRWTVKATHEGDFMGLPASDKKFETCGTDIYHFESGKIKEGWTVFDALTPALELGVVEVVQPAQSKK